MHAPFVHMSAAPLGAYLRCQRVVVDAPRHVGYALFFLPFLFWSGPSIHQTERCCSADQYNENILRLVHPALFTVYYDNGPLNLFFARKTPGAYQTR